MFILHGGWRAYVQYYYTFGHKQHEKNTCRLGVYKTEVGNKHVFPWNEKGHRVVRAHVIKIRFTAEFNEIIGSIPLKALFQRTTYIEKFPYIFLICLFLFLK